MSEKPNGKVGSTNDRPGRSSKLGVNGEKESSGLEYSSKDLNYKKANSFNDIEGPLVFNAEAVRKAELLGECWAAGAKKGSHALRVGKNESIGDLEDSQSSHHRLQRCFLAAALANHNGKKQ